MLHRRVACRRFKRRASSTMIESRLLSFFRVCFFGNRHWSKSMVLVYAHSVSCPPVAKSAVFWEGEVNDIVDKI